MGYAREIRCTAFVGGGLVLVMRFDLWDGTIAQQADVASAEYSIVQLDADDDSVATPVSGHTDMALVVADVVYDTLQTDPRWTADETGYNFLYALLVDTNAAFATAGIYRVTVTLTDNADQPIIVRWQVEVT